MIPREIIIHHSASSRDRTTLGDIENWHKARWSDFVSSFGWHIGYHYVITADGQVTHTRKNSELGAHCPPNEGRIGICLTGNFDLEMPLPCQLNTLQSVLEELKGNYQLTDNNIFGHYQKGITACPGKNLIDWLNKYRQISFLRKQIEAIKRLIENLLRK